MLSATLSRNITIDHTLVQSTKKTLRREISKKLRSLSQSEIDQQSQEIFSRLASLPAFLKAKSVSCFLNMPSGEVSTSSIVKEILRLDKSLFVPKIVKEDDRMRFLRIYDEADLNSLPEGTWGIREPTFQWENSDRMDAMNQETAPLDLIIVPGVAFDNSLRRLGHGKGYYDKFLTDYAAMGRPMPTLVALALREQILEDSSSIPVLEHDWAVDAIVTPDDVIQSNIQS